MEEEKKKKLKKPAKRNPLHGMSFVEAIGRMVRVEPEKKVRVKKK